MQNISQPTPLAIFQASLLIFLLLLVPVVLSNHPEGSVLGIFVFVVIFFFPGYLLLTLLGKFPAGLQILLSPIFGIVTMTTAYDICARASIASYFHYLVVALSVAGMTVFARQLRLASAVSCTQGHEAVIAGSVTALCVAPLLWRSGRFSGNEFVFYGPAGQDVLFHVSLLQRLLHHVPPDNLMVSGMRPNVYHYFDDLTLAFILRAQNTLHLGATDLFDLYYRCYPLFVYFLIGALAYCIGRQLLGKASGGVLSVLLLLGAGGLGWFFGVLQTAVHASHLAAMRAALFFEWASWDGVDAILPLVHRPAHYHGLLICLAAINILLRPERSRRDWILAGLLLGLMAGFNFTLAAIFGIATVLASLTLFLRRKPSQAWNLVWLGCFIFVGSLTVTSAMLLSGFHNVTPGFPFRGPNLEFPTTLWGTLLGRMLPLKLIPWVSLFLFPVVAYGVKLAGAGAMARCDLGEERHRELALVFAVAVVLSFVIGTFFPYQGVGGIAIVFLQPTLWILGLFSLHPLHAWLERNRQSWRAAALWAMLGLTWIQALAAFNFNSKAVFGRDTALVLRDIHSQAAPDDVVAYLPSELTEQPVWGHAEVSTNFSIMAMTGLDGYFSSPEYSRSHALPGLSGRDPAEVAAKAQRLYEQRRDDVESFVRGDTSDAASARLAKDHVRWIVVSGGVLPGIHSPALPWRQTSEIAVYRLSP